MNNGKLKPCLVIGTGIHKSFCSTPSPLSDWKTLILAVFDRLGVKIDPQLGHIPSVRWEQLIINTSTQGFRNGNNIWVQPKQFPAHKIEIEAKKSVAKVLADRSGGYPHRRSLLKYLNHPAWASVISLNFDCSWENTQPSYYHCSKLPKNINLLQIYGHIATSSGRGKQVWFPNGCIKKPNTLRLGIRDFGLQINSIHETFSQIKRFERIHRQAHGESALHQIQQFLESTQDYISIENQPIERSWILEFLFRPLVFVGVGLSQNESGLWWLLTQRARNLSRIPEKHRPPTILVRREADSDHDFFAIKPLGIDVVTTPTGDCIRKVALNCADQLS